MKGWGSACIFCKSEWTAYSTSCTTFPTPYLDRRLSPQPRRPVCARRRMHSPAPLANLGSEYRECQSARLGAILWPGTVQVRYRNHVSVLCLGGDGIVLGARTWGSVLACWVCYLNISNGVYLGLSGKSYPLPVPMSAMQKEVLVGMGMDGWRRYPRRTFHKRCWRWSL